MRLPHRTSTEAPAVSRGTAPAPISTRPVTELAGLRAISLIRAGFSVVWVALVVLTAHGLVAADRPTAIAAVLLVAYPLWDVAATVLARRLSGAGALDRVGVVNVALGAAAAIATGVAVLATVGTALLVFGVWALLSGAIQVVVAVRRRRSVGAQWPLIVSGAQSVLAGAAIAAMSASPTSGLSFLAGYSAFGAFWFVVSAIVLSVRIRRSR